MPIRDESITLTPNKMVVVPQQLLVELEQARKDLYAMYPSDIKDISTDTLLALTNVSNPMWVLANTKWKEAK